jgi:hypothetical protein
VAHWACGAGASPQFCAAVPARHTVGATLARTLGVATHMFDHRRLTTAMQAIGCQKRGKLDYALPSGCPALEWSVSFRLLGVYRWEIDGTVKCSHTGATRFAQRCLQEFAGPWWSKTMLNHPHIGDGTLFPVAKLAPWGTLHALKIQEMSAEESAARVAHDVRQYVQPFVAALGSEVDYLRALVQDNEPIRWFFGQPLARAAEIAWLASRLESTVQPLSLAVQREKGLLQQQLRDLELSVYVDRVTHAARGDA